MKSDTPPEEPVSDEPQPEPVVPEVAPEPTKDVKPASDPYEDKAVADIARNDADELLRAKDDEIERAFEPPKSRWQRFRSWCSNIWDQPRWRYSILGFSALIILTIAVIPGSRYFVLNTLGARAHASVVVQDDKTTQPVKNAVVSLAGQTGKTDQDGKVTLAHMKLGTTTLSVKKAAYSEVKVSVTLGLGSNDLGTKTLSAVGARLKFKALDWLSKKPLANAEATLGESSAQANDQGVIELPIEANQDDTMKVSIQAKHYTTKMVDASLADQKLKEVLLQISYPEYFISNRGGKFDLYRSDIDGTNEKVVLAGTGRESAQSLALTVREDRQYVALVSNRDANTNPDGYQYKTLTLIDASNDTAKKVASSEDIVVLGWDDMHLVYIKIAAGASAANASRHRLVSYNLSTGKEQELASSNYFVSALMMKGSVYYSPSDVYTDAKRGIYRIQPDASAKQAVYDQDTWGIYRTDWDQLTFQTPKNWFKYSTTKPVAEKLEQAPGNPHSTAYSDNHDRSKAVWFEERDGKGTILLRDTAAKTDKILKVQSGLSAIVGWAGDNHIIYRVASPTETADYVLSIDGGNPAKIKDVFNVLGQQPRY